MLVGYEMEWTIRSCRQEATIWRNRAARAMELEESGLAAYGLRQSAMWEDLIKLAEEQFQAVNGDYKTPSR